MTEVLVSGFASCYELEHLARLFYARAPLRSGRCTKGALVYARAGRRRMCAALRQEDGTVRLSSCPRRVGASEADDKLRLCRLLYDLLREATGITPPWGMLTGVRPVRLLRGSYATGGEAAARERLQGQYGVSEEKFQLALGIAGLQAPALALNKPHSYSLYVSIPFCPTRCAYCSFVSRTIGQEGHLVDAYLDKLELELAAVARVARQCELQLETVYIGGGTPTALNHSQLERLLQMVENHFEPRHAREYTVEAGRPDCTDFTKLAMLKAYGANRISINPQSLQPQVLHAIGRAHTEEDFFRCFEEARRAGHNCINTDLIAGLPEDNPDGFAKTLEGILALRPENVTVHTLTLKRASNLVLEAQQQASVPGAMLEGAYPALQQAGYRPYYLYRQKNTVDNLENTGWTCAGKEGLYNIYIMEETHTILAAGAGASTKLVAGDGAVIKRFYNHKLPLEYIGRHEEVLERKKGVIDFYASHLDTETPG